MVSHQDVRRESSESTHQCRVAQLTMYDSSCADTRCQSCFSNRSVHRYRFPERRKPGTVLTVLLSICQPGHARPRAEHKHLFNNHNHRRTSRAPCRHCLTPHKVTPPITNGIRLRHRSKASNQPTNKEADCVAHIERVPTLQRLLLVSVCQVGTWNYAASSRLTLFVYIHGQPTIQYKLTTYLLLGLMPPL
jgi:hypothetical protein